MDEKWARETDAMSAAMAARLSVMDAVLDVLIATHPDKRFAEAVWQIAMLEVVDEDVAALAQIPAYTAAVKHHLARYSRKFAAP